MKTLPYFKRPETAMINKRIIKTDLEKKNFRPCSSDQNQETIKETKFERPQSQMSKSEKKIKLLIRPTTSASHKQEIEVNTNTQSSNRLKTLPFNDEHQKYSKIKESPMKKPTKTDDKSPKSQVFHNEHNKFTVERPSTKNSIADSINSNTRNQKITRPLTSSSKAYSYKSSNSNKLSSDCEALTIYIQELEEQIRQEKLRRIQSEKKLKTSS